MKRPPNIRFTANDWQRIEHDWNAWWAGELDRPLVVIETCDPVEADRSQLSKFGVDGPADAIIDNWQKILEATHWLGDYNELEAITRTAGRGNACWGPCWSPGRGYMLQCDLSSMISPLMFERFVRRDLVSCCDALDYAFYHLDGRGEIPHLDHLLSIERLRGIQWQPGAGQPMAEGWLDLLKRIRDGGKLCQIYVTREGALTVQKTLGGRGFLMHIVNDPMDPSEARDFLETLQSQR